MNFNYRINVQYVLITGVLLLASCGGGGDGMLKPGTTGPTVTSTSPANHATGFASNSAITATFSEAMNPSTVTGNFILRNGGSSVAGAVNYSGTTATFTPTSALAYATQYSATITSGVEDVSGIAMAGNYVWTFTTGTAPDNTAPTVTATSPASNATGVAVNAAVSATFSENMNASTVTLSTFTLKNGGNSVTGTVSYSGTTATFTPASALAYSTQYTATITTGVTDAAGNAISSDRIWTFTTGAAPDTTAPTVTAISPVAGGTGISVNTTVTATFSETMNASTVTTATFTLKNGGNSVAGTVNYSGTTATFTPTNALANSTLYTATITTGVQDSAGNSMISNRTWTFTTTSAPDTTPPTVTAISPANGATGVATNATVTASFSESMNSSTIIATNFTLNNGGTNVAGTVSYGGTTATFTPTSALAYSTPYTATVTTGVKDVAGNAMTSNRTWTFTTQAAPPSGTVRILYLHHSTGEYIWNGDWNTTVPNEVAAYNTAHSTNYQITQLAYPTNGYPWENYPYDYWNLWVNHTGLSTALGEPNLEMLTQNYDVIVFKHCFPVSSIEADSGAADVSSSTKSLQNYYLQYAALKTRMLQFPSKKFIVWTGAALRADATDVNQATRAKTFFDWVKSSSWDDHGDNIYIWDFRTLETEGGLYLLDSYSGGDSHPNQTFSARVAPYFVNRLVDVIEGRGDSGSITGH